MDGFETRCKKCGEDGVLEVVSGTFSAQGMVLSEDGFSTMDAKFFNTDEEVAVCNLCGHAQSLSGDPLPQVVRPKHPGIYDLAAWMRRADEELRSWDRSRDVDADNALALKDLVSQAERYFRGGLVFTLAEALRSEEVPGADGIALRVVERMTGEKQKAA